jgi:hypothetical protein
VQEHIGKSFANTTHQRWCAARQPPVLRRRIADLDFTLIDKRKLLMDSRGHYGRPELLSLLIDRYRTAPLHERAAHPVPDAQQGPKGS